MAGSWTTTEVDKALAQSFDPFLPDKVFDIHAHLYRKQDSGTLPPTVFSEGPDVADLELWRKCMSLHVGEERVAGGLFFGLPFADVDREAMNAFQAEQASLDELSRMLVLVSPADDPKRIAELADGPRAAGFKVYHLYSDEKPTFESSIRGFLPEWVWQLADEREGVIMLHMVRALALSDKGNQQEIRDMCLAYPNAKLMLAHAARGFNIWHTIEGLDAIADLPNVYFDTAVNCEAGALVAILERFGPQKLFYGSDFPVSELRGRCVTTGTGFTWLSSDMPWWDQVKPFGEMALVGLEGVRAIQEAAHAMSLNESDLQDIFYNNAARLLKLEEPAPNQTQALYDHAKQRIPGGVQLLSKRPEQCAPNQFPAYHSEARGCEIWDLDGKRYLDVADHGIGACLLGYGHPDVNRAVKRRINLGSYSRLSSPDEVLLADRLCDLHPWAKQVRFARTGGEILAVATRIARATTGRSKVAICGYHGWHDWYLAANLGEGGALDGHLLPGLQPDGVPDNLRGSALTFAYNDLAAFEKIMQEHGSEIAAVVMETCRYADPVDGFLEKVKQIAHKNGALLIFDEITIGWRLAFGGAHLLFDTTPDMAVFAKSLGNGYPVAAVIGTPQAMDGAHHSFISSTYWTEGIGSAAALAVLDVMEQVNVPAHCARIGKRVQQSWSDAATEHNVPLVVGEGYPQLAKFHFEHEQAAELRTLYIQHMLDRGFLANSSIYATLAHTDAIIDAYSEAIDEVIGELAATIQQDRISASLRGPVAHSGFRRLV